MNLHPDNMRPVLAWVFMPELGDVEPTVVFHDGTGWGRQCDAASIDEKDVHDWIELPARP